MALTWPSLVLFGWLLHGIQFQLPIMQISLYQLQRMSNLLEFVRQITSVFPPVCCNYTLQHWAHPWCSRKKKTQLALYLYIYIGFFRKPGQLLRSMHNTTPYLLHMDACWGPLGVKHTVYPIASCRALYYFQLFAFSVYSRVLHFCSVCCVDVFSFLHDFFWRHMISSYEEQGET